jgi:hypothetical protein
MADRTTLAQPREVRQAVIGSPLIEKRAVHAIERDD